MLLRCGFITRSVLLSAGKKNFVDRYMALILVLYSFSINIQNNWKGLDSPFQNFNPNSLFVDCQDSHRLYSLNLELSGL